ncbi:ROK family transcriptional regulator [Camelliibacillus cellulosilyticus]
MQKKDQNYIKKENKGLVLDLIRTDGPLSRADIAKKTKMSPTTVSRIVASLIELNLVEETDQYTTGVGRKASLLAVKADSFFSIGVEIDEKWVRMGMIDFLGHLIKTDEVITNVDDEPAVFVMKLKEMLERFMANMAIQKDRIIGICIGVPGLINNLTGTVDISAQLNWHNVSLASQLEREIGLKVMVDNELKLKAYAERLFGKGRESKKLLMIGFGSGVGSALIIDGEIYRGHSNTAGEIGHTIVDPNGMLCPCGNFGCLQTYIAERFLLEEASKKADVRELQDIIMAAKNDEKWAVNIVERAVTYAAITINNSVCVNNPDKVILTGSLIDQSPYIREKILEMCDYQLWTPLKHSFTLEVSDLGSTGIVLGAGMIAQKHFINQLNFEEELIL